MNIFAFSISKTPQSINKPIEQFAIDGDEIGYYIFHQVNLFLNEKIRKKLNHIACGFGVGLSWATMYFSTNKIHCPKLIVY